MAHKLLSEFISRAHCCPFALFFVWFCSVLFVWLFFVCFAFCGFCFVCFFVGLCSLSAIGQLYGLCKGPHQLSFVAFHACQFNFRQVKACVTTWRKPRRRWTEKINQLSRRLFDTCSADTFDASQNLKLAWSTSLVIVDKVVRCRETTWLATNVTFVLGFCCLLFCFAR